MKTNQDLIGKTITGVIAVSPPEGGAREIWMMQFSDGSHVEFVSPQARRRLKRQRAPGKRTVSRRVNDLQLALNVA